jgi:hypothetical protein
MAVQINEVIIRAVVDPRPNDETNDEVNCPPGTAGSSEGELLEKVLEILREKQER